jgi:hypothetical protein
MLKIFDYLKVRILKINNLFLKLENFYIFKISDIKKKLKNIIRILKFLIFYQILFLFFYF